MDEETYSEKSKTVIQTPRPSSPRKFFARIYGHLEQQTNTKDNAPGSESDSSSDVEIGDNEGRESVQPSSLWQPPPPLPLCPRPILLPHQQLAFGAGLAAFCKYYTKLVYLLYNFLLKIFISIRKMPI